MAEGGPECGERKRRKLTLASGTGAIPFISALVVMAQKGDVRAISKLADIERWLKSIVEILH